MGLTIGSNACNVDGRLSLFGTAPPNGFQPMADFVSGPGHRHLMDTGESVTESLHKSNCPADLVLDHLCTESLRDKHKILVHRHVKHIE